MNLYEIRINLLKYKKQVFSINEFARIIRIKKSIASVYINRMLKKKLIFRLERGKLSLNEDPFISASQIAFPAYLSLSSALYLHGIIKQVPDKIYLITSMKKKSLNIFGMSVILIKVNPKLMFGYSQEKKGESYIYLADIEKAVIDSLYFLRYCRIIYILEAIKKANTEKLESYALKLNKEVIIRRLGYLMDLLGVKHSLKRKNNTSYKLNPQIKSRGKFNKKWYLYVNEEVNLDAV